MGCRAAELAGDLEAVSSDEDVREPGTTDCMASEELLGCEGTLDSPFPCPFTAATVAPLKGAKVLQQAISKCMLKHVVNRKRF